MKTAGCQICIARLVLDDLLAHIERCLNIPISLQFGHSTRRAVINVRLTSDAVFDTGRFVIKSNRGDKRVTPLEGMVLMHFINHPSIILTRKQILDAVWGMDAPVDERAVDCVLSKLRGKIGNHQSPIETVRGFGYRFHEFG